MVRTKVPAAERLLVALCKNVLKEGKNSESVVKKILKEVAEPSSFQYFAPHMNAMAPTSWSFGLVLLDDKLDLELVGSKLR